MQSTQDSGERLGAAIARASGEPALRDFTVHWPNLLRGEKSDPGAALDEIGKRLSTSKRSAIIRVTLAEGDTESSWSLALKSGRSKVSRASTAKPSLEIITSTATWSAIAGGRLSPLEAFGSGRLRVRGDIELARLVARRVSDT